MMWDILGHIGLILGIIVSIGSIFGYFAKALPFFKNFQAQNQQTRNPDVQSSTTNNSQYRTRNLIIPTVIGIVFVSIFSFSIAYMNYHYDLTTAFLGIVTLNDIMVGFLAVIPLFFGAVYGFWVGLAVGGIGFFIGGTI
jgi:hypothetical protein